MTHPTARHRARALMAADARETRLERLVENLYANDRQFAAADSDPSVSDAANRPGLRLVDVVRTVLSGYSERPALGSRATELVTDAAGRTSLHLLPRFETSTYGEVFGCVRATAAALHDSRVEPHDRVAILGFTSSDHLVVDIAIGQLGAVAVPLPTGAPQALVQPIITEVEPSLIASSVDHVADAVDLILTGPAPKRLIVFDYRPEVDAQREAYEAAVAALADTDVVVETLADVQARGTELPFITNTADSNESIALLLYTSGSTGAPKGAIYREQKVVDMWRVNAEQRWVPPAITLNILPMSHGMGRGSLYRTLAAGGTAYFTARSDLSTFLEDLALVRPTHATFVPRIWEMLHQEYVSRIQRAGDQSEEFATSLQQRMFGGRCLGAMTGSAPLSPQLRAWVEDLLGTSLVDGFGATEAGPLLMNGQVLRPPVIDYKLVDVPELGYYGSDVPHPRGELAVKSEEVFPGYYKRPDITAKVFDADGYYCTGDIFAEVAPDHLRYVDRRNNVTKLSQGEFVTVSKLEASFSTSPLVAQIFVYGNSARPYLLAVVVPSDEAVRRYPATGLKPAIAASLRDAARNADLHSYEIPRDFLIETAPFTLENGLLTGISKLAWPKLKAKYGPRLEQLYAELADGQDDELHELRSSGSHRPTLETVRRAACALLAADVSDVTGDTQFNALGGDSLSAVTFSNLLQNIFDVEVPVGVIVSPVSDLAAIATYVDEERSSDTERPTFAVVHGRNAVEVNAADLELEKFFDEATMASAQSLPGLTTRVRTVLLTGATGFLGRYLALQWLERMKAVDGKVICLVRAKDDVAAHARLDETFDGADPRLTEHFRDMAREHLEVLAADKGERNLGLDDVTWQRLADTVDAIVDSAALVNHVLPYSQLFGPNVVGTAELIRLALTTRIKPFIYVSTVAVVAGIDAVEDADVRTVSASRRVDDSYANGYATSKWAGEVLLREAHDRFGLPVSVFRCDMIMADMTYTGQLNVPDIFTRMILSLVATGIAPKSLYYLDSDGNRQRAHYDGLPVEFIADAISSLWTTAGCGFETYNVMNPHDDGVSLDTFVDWLIDAGHPIRRIDEYGDWLRRFETALRTLPDAQRQASLLPLLHVYQEPQDPVNGALAPADRFRAAAKDRMTLSSKDIPHLSAPSIVKYVTDLQLLGLL